MINSKQIGDDFEMLVLKDLESRGFEFIVRNVHMKGTGCEVDFVAKNEHLVWHVEAKGGKAGYKKRPGAKRTDNVKKSIANAALIKALYPDTYYVSYFSSRPKIGSYSREMLDTALESKFIDQIIYLEEDILP
jgi:Holliday junction resolvase-like predicted endonuclease